ncbi:MAG: M14 family zinc carboxypeptidase [Bacteroidetes bacterium]|nr:M14 family zinc carboxypeptidase [Bacteroidota bacterium]
MVPLHTFAHELFTSYPSFFLSAISTPHFTQREMLQWIKPMGERGLYRSQCVGTSTEGRPLMLYSLGSGPTTVLLWSQMHGDEPTATMALLDMIGWFNTKNQSPIAQYLREQLTIHFLPMLNPDGAERFQRRTAYHIDMNRDAQTLKTPEARTLKYLYETLKPEFCFNLHDQNPRLTVGSTKKFTALALLAPAVDEINSDTTSRLRAKQLASLIATVAHHFIPGHVARWNDFYEPRAFGESIQRWGTSILLIESGGWKNDPNKFFIRKMNTIVLLTSLYAIAQKEYTHYTSDVYDSLPFNAEYGFDYIVRNALYSPQKGIEPVRVDVGININRSSGVHTNSIHSTAKIMDIGDLAPFIAYEEIDGSTRYLNPEVVYPENEFPVEKMNTIFIDQ